MNIRIDDLPEGAELPEEMLDAVVGGRPPMTPPSMKVCTASNPPKCWDPWY